MLVLNHIINEINTALDHNAYIAALSLALTLPDICGKAEFGEVGNRKRYIDWYDKYVGVVFENALSEPGKPSLPYLSGEVIYSLRCFLLHQGTPNIDGKSMKCNENKITKFVLLCEPKKENGLYIHEAMRREQNKELTVNIRGLCQVLTVSALEYYRRNIEKFNFFNYTLVYK